VWQLLPKFSQVPHHKTTESKHSGYENSQISISAELFPNNSEKKIDTLKILLIPARSNFFFLLHKKYPVW
jgi:hypothetical protein